MHKKLITASLALVALAAFALPAAAQATNTPVITHPTGTILAGTPTIKGTNIGDTLMTNTTGNVEVRCTAATMTGTLTKNETGNVQGNISSAVFTGTGTGGACKGFSGFLNVTVDPLNMGTGAGQGWCLKSTSAMATDEFQVLGGKCSEAAKKIEFRYTIGAGTCTYRSTTTTAIKGELTTDTTGDAILTTPRSTSNATTDAGFEKIDDTTFGNVCSASGALDMQFTLETDAATAEPVYISS
jgi:hypothetical protein